MLFRIAATTHVEKGETLPMATLEEDFSFPVPVSPLPRYRLWLSDEVWLNPYAEYIAEFATYSQTLKATAIAGDTVGES